ncbi:GMC family oxidoreductase [Salinarimonas sp.]|uniref:GMC family oxidoreductase n=1 Tax=Salinarimonas sp. TaxID=2766526 RepID=UPI0032D91076
MIGEACERSDDADLTCQICIVGAGAAGIALAVALAGTSIDVVVLEAGGRTFDRRAQDLYRGEVVDERLHSPLHTYRARRFGGSTTIWGGRCVPFDPIDFEQRDWVPHSGWPIARADLEPFYARANALCEAGAYAYTAPAAFRRPMREIVDGFRSDAFQTDTLERFSPPTDFAQRYGPLLERAANVRVLLGASVTEVEVDAADGRRVRRVRYATESGRVSAVRAAHVVLATGGLEVTRLLLASRRVHPNGIGNARDLVGRFYMCHLAGTIGEVALAPGQVWHGYDLADGGVYCRRRFALSPDAQRRHRVGNVIARLHHPRITDPAHRTGALSLLWLAQGLVPYEYRKRLVEHTAPRPALGFAHAGNVVRDAAGTSAFVMSWLRRRTLAARKLPSVVVRPRSSVYCIDFHAEQTPNPASRVSLTTGTDRLGLPMLRVDWRYLPQDVHTVATALSLLQRDFADSGAGVLAYDPDSVEHEMTRYGAYGGHHLGTTRMGVDPNTSVVDPTCRIHGMDNLFVASAAVFPTSSQANPTLTVVALALRLADHLVVQVAREWAAPVLASTPPGEAAAARPLAAASHEPVVRAPIPGG